MNEEKVMEEGLEETKETKKTGNRRAQTPEELELINAGIDTLRQSPDFDPEALKVIETLAPVWHSEDKDALAAAKEQVINEFGGSDKFKDFCDEKLADCMKGFAGIAKLIPVVNNIKTFYARRPSTRKAPTMQINIGGTYYSINKDYYESIKDKGNDEKRELLLQHADTKKVNDIPEIL